MSLVSPSSRKQGVITSTNLGQLDLQGKTVKTLNKAYRTVNKSCNIKTYTKNAVNLKTIAANKYERSRSLLISDNPELSENPKWKKRKVLMRKIELEPKYNYKVIATTNKRKRTTPRRDERPPPPMQLPLRNSPADEELSIEELVRLAEEQGMDDEDFIEILTCPSPVWWEDLNDDQEEMQSMFQDCPTDQNNTSNEKLYENNKTKNSEVNVKADIKFFKKFVEKRSKLENVLGNIKLKKTMIEIDCDKNEHTEVLNKSRCDSVGGLSDASINEEELLNTLENIEIPVQKDDDDSDNVKDLIVIEHPSDTVKQDVCNTCEKPPKKQRRRKTMHKPTKESNDIDIEIIDLKNGIHEIINTNELEMLPVNLLQLTKNSFGNIDTSFACVSPKSIDSVASDVTHTSIIEYDSISDTNIRFLDEYDETNESDKNELKAVGKDAELVTVYKILSHNNIDVEDQIKINLVNKMDNIVNKLDLDVTDKDGSSDDSNSSKGTVNSDKHNSHGNDKTMNGKKTKKMPTKSIKINKDTNSTIKVLNTEVKYCRKCSSIFETDNCLYCLKKT